jgi:hypothetical protein
MADIVVLVLEVTVQPVKFLEIVEGSLDIRTVRIGPLAKIGGNQFGFTVNVAHQRNLVILFLLIHLIDAQGINEQVATVMRPSQASQSGVTVLAHLHLCAIADNEFGIIWGAPGI